VSVPERWLETADDPSPPDELFVTGG
jgi:hypothetical protein